MTQQMPPYLDRRYPSQASVNETKNASHEVQKRLDERCWNGTKEKFYNLQVDINKYVTFERSECFARFVGKFPNRANGVYNHYRLSIQVG